MRSRKLDIDELTPEDRELAMQAVAIQDSAYAPYSHFGVGAAVRSVDGAIYVGSNLENASYGLSICAEVSALTAANTARAFNVSAIAIFGMSLDPSPNIDEGAVTTPCGRCRQLISEAAQVSGRDVRVLAVAQDRKSVLMTTIGELLPHAFGPVDLGVLEPPSPTVRLAR